MEDTIARDRNGLEVLTYAECLQLLADHRVGRVAFVDAGTPVIVPVNYVLDGRSIIVRSARGSKDDTADRHRPFAFEIDHHDAETRTGWSVLATGLAEQVDDDGEVARFEQVLDAWALGDRADVHLLRLRADTVTGRRLVASA